MWLFTKGSFVSVVQHRDQPNNLLVRARVRKHLVKLLPKRAGQIQETPDADYRYRLVISKKEFAKVVTDYVMQNLKYDNFKAAQDHSDPKWDRFLMEVWQGGLHL